MNVNTEVKFPCGYEYKFNIEVSALACFGSEVKDDLPKECPLHGKECKKE